MLKSEKIFDADFTTLKENRDALDFMRGYVAGTHSSYGVIDPDSEVTKNLDNRIKGIIIRMINEKEITVRGGGWRIGLGSSQ